MFDALKLMKSPASSTRLQRMAGSAALLLVSACLLARATMFVLEVCPRSLAGMVVLLCSSSLFESKLSLSLGPILLGLRRLRVFTGYPVASSLSDKARTLFVIAVDASCERFGLLTGNRLLRAHHYSRATSQPSVWS